jgi:hypothetical protein
MEYRTRPHRMLNTGILLVSVVLLLSVIPFTDTTEAESHKISGYVVDTSDVAIENVKVTLFDPDNGDIRSDITDGAGFFSIYAPAGHYLISYSQPMYVTPTSLIQMNEKDSYLGFIQLTKIAGQDATLTGHVEDTAGNNGRYAYVYLIDTNGANDGQDLYGQPMGNTIMTRANRNGDYTFDEAYTGTFDLVVRMGSSQYYFGGDTSITLAAGVNNAPDVVYTDWTSGRTLTIIPLDTDNQPINNAEVIFLDAANNMWNSTSANPASVKVPDGTYDLIIKANGFQTHIEQFTVTKNQHYQVNMMEAIESVATTDVTFNAWDDVDYQSSVSTQFDHGAYFRSVEYGIFSTGIIRYDVDRVFGNGDQSLSGPEADLYENFLENTIGSDGDSTRNAFMVGDTVYDYTYSNYGATFTESTSNVRSTDAVTFDYTYDLTSTIGDATVYRVYYTLGRHIQEDVTSFYENATFTLPPMYEVDWEKECGLCEYVVHHSEDDTSVVYIDGFGDAEFHSRENVLPTPMAVMTDDFIPTDDMYIYMANEYIEFNGTNSYDGSTFGMITDYEWTFDNWTGGGGNTNNTATAIRMFAEGTYTATLKVTDNAGGVNTMDYYFVVDATAPTVDFTVEPAMVDQGTSENDMTRAFMNITVLNDANGIFDLFSWDFGDEYNMDITVFDDRNVTYHYSDLNKSMLTSPGSNEYEYTVTLTVWDQAGNENTATQDVKVNATKRPEAMFEISDDLVTNDDMYVFGINEEITFNATESMGENAEITDYFWDFGDSRGTGTGMVLNHTFTVQGAYDVVLTVTDEYGATGTYTMTIYIDGATPTVTFTIEGAWMNDGKYFIDQKNNTNTLEEYLINLTAEGTVDNGPVGAISGLYNFSWSFEEADKPGFADELNTKDNVSEMDTTYSFTAIDVTAMNTTFDNMTHYYYTITLKVWDLAGNSGMHQKNIYVNDTEDPIARFSNAEDFDEGTMVEINATTSSDNIGIATYQWAIYFPNGTQDDSVDNSTAVWKYVFALDGDYTVVLNVTDAAGNMDTHEDVVTAVQIPRPDMTVTSNDIFYSVDTILEGETIDILANITNTGEFEARNVTVQFWFRNSNGDKTQIGEDQEIEGMMFPTETRIINQPWKATKSGEIVVNVFLNGNDVNGNWQVDGNPEDNEAFADVRVEAEDEDTPWGIILGVSTIGIILFAAFLVFWFKPELMGIKPAKGGKSRK